MAYFIQLVFAGIALGCIYALIGLGFTIIFKASEVINFAQGSLLLVGAYRSEEHTSELQSLTNLVCRLLLEKKNKNMHVSTPRNSSNTTRRYTYRYRIHTRTMR